MKENKILSKEQFVKALKELQQVDEFTAEVNEVKVIARMRAIQ